MRKFIKYKDVYMVSSVGEVWKIENNKLIPKKLSPSKVGYLVTSINNKIEYVHRIVMTAFCGNSEKHVDHINIIIDLKTSNMWRRKKTIWELMKY